MQAACTFHFLHKTRIKTLFTSAKVIRYKPILLSCLICIVMLSLQFGVEWLIYRPGFKGFGFFPEGRLLTNGVDVIIFFIVVSIITIRYIAYLMPRFTMVVKKPWVAILITFSISLIPYFLAEWMVNTFGNTGLRPSFYVNKIPNTLLSGFDLKLLIPMIPFAIWVLMDDGLELVIGWIAGISLFSNMILGRHFGRAWFPNSHIFNFNDSRWPTFNTSFEETLVEVFLPTIGICLATFLFSKIYNWSNWRSRLFGTYQKPAFADEWEGKIDTIGGDKNA